jgi:hypothetical protein
VKYPDGVYVGQMDYGMREGFGAHFFDDGARFIGYWKMDA